ncbi:MAG: hypothetical protein ABJH06_09300 [Paraglaciecola sp.]|uniref:hypothetical protein n=1 Tax=Paraglaciecola sp. TaxID=1920173 RepID=UPI0032992E1D
MKSIVILLISLFSSLHVIAECLFLENQTEIKEVSALRNQATIVLDAEGENCDSITGRDKRISCQCKCRKEPLIKIKIKIKNQFDEVLSKKPEYSERTVCYSEKTNQAISVNFIAYKHMATWCI